MLKTTLPPDFFAIASKQNLQYVSYTTFSTSQQIPILLKLHLNVLIQLNPEVIDTSVISI